jgi:apolipoprotein N-acyltransferase
VPWIKYPAWVAAALYLALFGGLTTWMAGSLARRFPLAVVFPAVLVTVEELRGSGELGFPWFQPGYTQSAYAPVLQLASLGGVMLVTLWIALLNVLLWRALSGGSRARAALGAALLLLLPWAWGSRVLDAAPRTRGTRIALIQANIAGEIKWSGKHQSEILNAFLRLTERAATRRPALAIWPETATGTYMKKQLDQAVAVAELAHRTQVPIFAGFADYDFAPDGRVRSYNAAGLFDVDGHLSPIYAKRHLVPFGERMPFEWLLPALARVNFGQAEWTPGKGVVLFPSAAGPFACLVCFEGIFPDLSRQAVRSGARWLVNVTNDEWFGNSVAIQQHAAMSAFRAVENHVPLARCANTGLTVLYDAYGRPRASLPVFRAAALIADLPPPGLRTGYTRAGDWPGMLAAIVLIGAFALALTRPRTRH